MKKFFLRAAFLMVFLMACSAYAQQVEFSSTLNPVGSGARAMGMGGAFIGVADDATAASWNPAGLVQLEKPEISIVHSYFARSQEYVSDIHPETETLNRMDTSGINYASAAYPFVFLKHNMIVSINYQRLYEMNKSVDFKFNFDDDIIKFNDDVKFKQSGYLYTLSPALAVQVTRKLYLGATLNIWDDITGDNGWENDYRSSGSGTLFGSTPFSSTMNIHNRFSFSGVNAHLGFLWKVYGPLTIGGVFKTPFDASLKKETEISQVQEFPSVPSTQESSAQSSENEKMKMPASYGIGFAYRHSDNLTLGLDFYRTEWSQFLIRDSEGNETNPYDGQPISNGRLKDTLQVRLGGEYIFIREKDVIPVRAGIFYDPEPEKGSVGEFYGFSLGAGYARSRFAFDMAYSYRFGKDIPNDLGGVEGINMDVNQHTLMTSLIYHF